MEQLICLQVNISKKRQKKLAWNDMKLATMVSQSWLREIDLKIEMLKCHKSQIDWLNDHDGTDSIDQIKLVAKFRGMQCGVEYAEAFTQCQAYLKGTTKRLLP